MFVKSRDTRLLFWPSILVLIPARMKLIPTGMELIPAGTEVIVANRTDLFRNISTLSLHGKIDVGCHLLRDTTC